MISQPPSTALTLPSSLPTIGMTTYAEDNLDLEMKVPVEDGGAFLPALNFHLQIFAHKRKNFYLVSSTE